MQRQSPEDINFTCIQSRQHPPSKALYASPPPPSSPSSPAWSQPSQQTSSLSNCTPPPPPSRNTPLSPSLSLLALHHLGMGWHEKTQAQNPTRPWDQQLLLDLPHKQREEGEENARYPPPTPTKKNTIQKHALLFQNALSHPNWPLLSLSLFFVLVHVKSPNSTDTETH